MKPVSPLLVSILEPALVEGATDVRLFLDQGAVHWMRGESLVATGALPPGAFEELATELCSFGAQRDDVAEISLNSPVGPLRFRVALSPSAMHLFLRDEAVARAEEAFSELVAHLDAVGADRVTCANDEAAFAKGDKLIETVPLVPDAFALLVTYGKSLGGLEGEERSGRAVLFKGSGERRMLEIALVEGGIAFKVTDA